VVQSTLAARQEGAQWFVVIAVTSFSTAGDRMRGLFNRASGFRPKPPELDRKLDAPDV